jgi:hypothetical protein
MKAFHFYAKSLIRWGICFFIAIVVSVIIDGFFPSFWDSSRLFRWVIFILTLVICAFLLNLLLNYFIQLFTIYPKSILVLYLIFSLVFTIVVSVCGYTPISSLPSITFKGAGGKINQIINLIILLVVQPSVFLAIVSLLGNCLIRVDKISKLNTISNQIFNFKNYSYFFVIAIIILELLPLYGVSDIKNISQNFWGRGVLIKLFSDTNLTLGNEVYDRTLLEKDNWLIYIGENCLDDYQNTIPFTPQELTDIQRKLDSLAGRLASKGAKLIVIVPPNKNTIYPEYFPTEIPKIGNRSRLDQLVDYGKSNGKMQILDLRPALIKAREQKRVYYKTDTHWNDFGAFVAYQEIMKEVKKWYPEVEVHTISDFQFVPITFSGDISQMMVKTNISEETTVMKPVFERNIYMRTWLTDPGSRPNILTTKSDKNAPRLLMFRDSFAIALQPFLSDHFSNAVFIWSFFGDESYYDTEKPDIVILELTERYLRELLSIPG